MLCARGSSVQKPRPRSEETRAAWAPGWEGPAPRSHGLHHKGRCLARRDSNPQPPGAGASRNSLICFSTHSSERRAPLFPSATKFPLPSRSWLYVGSRITQLNTTRLRAAHSRRTTARLTYCHQYYSSRSSLVLSAAIPIRYLVWLHPKDHIANGNSEQRENYRSEDFMVFFVKHGE